MAHNYSDVTVNTPQQANGINDYDRKELYRAVKSLPDNYRVPFTMFVSGFKYHEIATKLSLPLGTVKSRIFFTRRILQEELKDFV